MKKIIAKAFANKFIIILCTAILYLFVAQSCVRMRMSAEKTASFFKKANVPFIDKIINFKNYNIHYIESGEKSKRTLIFVHGSPGSWDAYKMYLTDSLLLKEFRIIAVDRPGFGYSNFGFAQNLNIQTNRIVAFIDSLDIKKPITIIGHSLGGPLVLSMAAARPQQFEHVVVLSGAVDPNLENPEIWRPILMAKPIRYLIPGALRPSNDELWWLKNDLINLKPSLSKIQSTVTVIHGSKDRLVPYANVKFMQLNLTGTKKTEILTLKNADHFIPWTHFEIIRNKLLNLQ